MNIVEIKEIPDRAASLVGLDKYNRSKIPNTAHVVMARKGQDGRYITGIDEDSVTLNKIRDTSLREQEYNRRRSLRLRLEQLLNISLDANCAYWETFMIDLSTLKVLTLDNPKDLMRYEFLVANQHVAPDEGVAGAPEYRNCKYFFYRKEVSDSERVSKQRTIDTSKAQWLEVSANDAKARVFAAYCLGNKISPEYSTDTRYSLMSDWLADVKNAIKFQAIVKMKPEDLHVKIIIDFAKAKNVIRFRDGYYQRGNATYGRTEADVLEWFQSAGNAAELLSLKEEIENEYNFKV